MLTLAIETSGPTGSVALFEAGRVLAEQSLELGRQHGQSLIPTIRALLEGCGKTPSDCRLVAVGVGPGSFTGLRVGVVCAKTFAYAVKCQIVAVDTFQAIACNSPADVARVAVIADAQRGNLYAQKFARTGVGDWAPVEKIQIVPVEAWAAGLFSDDVVSGPALDKLAHLAEGRCRALAPECRVSRAASIARLGIQAVEAGHAADLWSVEPLYFGRSSAEVQWEKLHGVRREA